MISSSLFGDIFSLEGNLSHHGRGVCVCVFLLISQQLNNNSKKCALMMMRLAVDRSITKPKTKVFLVTFF